MPAFVRDAGRLVTRTPLIAVVRGRSGCRMHKTSTSKPTWARASASRCTMGSYRSFWRTMQIRGRPPLVRFRRVRTAVDLLDWVDDGAGAGDPRVQVLHATAGDVPGIRLLHELATCGAEARPELGVDAQPGDGDGERVGRVGHGEML